jgi:hypothetical protein
MEKNRKEQVLLHSGGKSLCEPFENLSIKDVDAPVFCLCRRVLLRTEPCQGLAFDNYSRIHPGELCAHPAEKGSICGSAGPFLHRTPMRRHQYSNDTKKNGPLRVLAQH